MDEMWFLADDVDELATPDSFGITPTLIANTPTEYEDGSSSTESTITAPIVTTGPSAPASTGKVRRRPIPRKGHTKSRRGCYNCKRRKVKCQETLPACGHCTRIGLACKYPPRRTPPTTDEEGEQPGLLLWSSSSTSPSGFAAAASPCSALQSWSAGCTMPAQFSLDDLRLFTHFLQVAYPPLPLRGDAIWRDVAALSHGFDYLVHAMLGLAASHLNLLVPPTGKSSDTAAGDESGSLASRGLAHRVTAIRLLNESLDRPCASRAEANARFATIMSLTFQASYFPDGMAEFLSMVRGCSVVAGTAMFVGDSKSRSASSSSSSSSSPSAREMAAGLEGSLFAPFSPAGHHAAVIEIAGDNEAATGGAQSRPLEAPFVEAVLASLRAVAPLCRSATEIRYLVGIEAAVRLARTAPAEAFAGMSDMYSLVAECSADDFATFVAPDNRVAHVLLAHFFAVEFAVASRVLGAMQAPFLVRKKMTRLWLERLVDGMTGEWLGFVQWPMQFARELPE